MEKSKRAPSSVCATQMADVIFNVVWHRTVSNALRWKSCSLWYLNSDTIVFWWHTLVVKRGSPLSKNFQCLAKIFKQLCETGPTLAPVVTYKSRYWKGKSKTRLFSVRPFTTNEVKIFLAADWAITLSTITFGPEERLRDRFAQSTLAQVDVRDAHATMRLCLHPKILCTV